MKITKRDSIEFYPEYNYEAFKKQLADSEKEAKEKGSLEIVEIGFSRDGEANLYFNRMETDQEYNLRIFVEQENIKRELRELERLKNKYESIPQSPASTDSRD